MSFAYEDTLFDLELDFFVHQPTTNYTVPELQAKIDRLRKSIIFLKPRVRQLSHYVAAFKILTRELEVSKHNETRYKDICKQHLAEINVFTSKVTLLEDEKLVAETREREKNEKIWELENKVIALQTIHTQLKLLVQEKNKSEFTPVKVIKKKGKVSAADKAQIRFLEKEIETLRKDNAKILNLQKENEKLHRENTRIPILEKEIENLLVSKSSKINDQYEITRIQQLEQEVETLRKENFKILKLEAEIEILNKDNANIPKFMNEIGKLHKENAKILMLQKDIEILNKDNANIPKYLKEIEKLQKENAKILKLEKEIKDLNKENVSLNKENVQIPNLMKEIGNLRKENAKITKLEKEIESLNKEIETLHKGNAKKTKFGNRNETIFKQNIKISNMEKDIETLHIKNGEIEIVNKAFSKERVISPNKGEEIASHLNNPTLTIKEKGELSPLKSDLTRKYKLLPGSNSGCSDNSEAENYEYGDPLLSLTPNNTIVAITSPIADEYNAVPCESDNENSNEVISIDTGRGSSLANSDIEKGLHSPEHFCNDSPSNGHRIDNIEKTEDVIMSSSPIPAEKIDTPTFTIVECNDILNVCEHVSASFRKSYSKLFNSDNQANAARKVSNSVIISDNVSCNSSKTRTQGVQEKECLELNNSLQCESHADLELEQIFSTMKLNYNAVTPIPKTPIRVHEEDSRSGPSGPKEKDDTCITSDKTSVFMKKVAELLLLYAQTAKSDTNNEIEELITSLQSLLKSKHTHTENSTPNKMSNLEKSDNVLSHGDNNLRSILNPGPAKSSVQKYTDARLRSKKDEHRLTQNIMSQSLSQHENHNQLLRNDNNSILNPSPPNKNTNVLNNKQVEKGSHCLSMSVDENPEQLLNSTSEEFATDSGLSRVISIGKKTKNKKNSKLEKLKKKLKPKYKIRREETPTENLRMKAKQIFAIKKNVTVNDTAASLNDKAVYEKAVKIMAEINSQQSAKSANSPPKHTKGALSPRPSACSEKGIQSNGDNQECHNYSTARGKIKLSELGLTTCTVVLIKDPLLLSPRKIGNSTTHKAKEDNNSATYVPKDNNNSLSLTAKEDNASTHRAIENNDSITQKAKENNNSTSTKEKEDNNSTTHKAKENNNSSTLEAKEDNNSTIHRLNQNNISTNQQANEHRAKEENNSMTHEGKEDQNFTSHSVKEDHESFDELPRKRRRRSSNEPLAQYKRVLRSDTVHKRLSTEDNIELSNSKGESNKGPRAIDSDTQLLVHNHENTLQCLKLGQHSENIVSYGDLDIFSEDSELERKMTAPVEGRALINADLSACHPKESILCRMIEKYGVERVKPFEKKIPDKIVKPISEKIEQEITKIKQMTDTKSAMNSFVADLRKLNYKHFIAGLIDYLMKPERKNELFGKVSSSPAPAMTKAEQILLYVIAHLKTHWPSVDIVDAVLSSIEFALFKLNRTPEFNVIESSSHFYAVLCRYFKAKSRLRLFILDAMYCIQYKSVPLIKQCLDVWMHIIPLAHMGIAKSPMVTCLVYLLHFYKCDDRLNRVQDIRNILIRKYFYQITDWNESKILEMFKNSIKDLKDISLEKKMLRLALVILAKRQGPQWCQTHIIKNLLQPMIEKENVPNNVKEFCVSMIGPLMKPYPADMKVHCEIAINQLVDILNNNPSPKMEEAAITSMIYINRHDQRSINKMLLSRKMNPMSMELHKSIREYVKSKPLKIWKKNLAAIAR